MLEVRPGQSPQPFRSRGNRRMEHYGRKGKYPSGYKLCHRRSHGAATWQPQQRQALQPGLNAGEDSCSWLRRSDDDDRSSSLQADDYIKSPLSRESMTCRTYVHTCHTALLEVSGKQRTSLERWTSILLCSCDAAPAVF